MNPPPATDIAYRVLKLEQQLESYERLHGQELAEIRRALEEVRLLLLDLSRKAGPIADKEEEEA